MFRNLINVFRLMRRLGTDGLVYIYCPFCNSANVKFENHDVTQLNNFERNETYDVICNSCNSKSKHSEEWVKG